MEVWLFNCVDIRNGRFWCRGEHCSCHCLAISLLWFQIDWLTYQRRRRCRQHAVVQDLQTTTHRCRSRICSKLTCRCHLPGLQCCRSIWTADTLATVLLQQQISDDALIANYCFFPGLIPFVGKIFINLHANMCLKSELIFKDLIKSFMSDENSTCSSVLSSYSVINRPNRNLLTTSDSVLKNSAGAREGR